MLFTVVAGVALTTLLILEQSAAPHTDTSDLFLDAFFEVVSALGTVGLSTGITSQLTAAGRNGHHTADVSRTSGTDFGLSVLSLSERNGEVVYPDEDPLIG